MLTAQQLIEFENKIAQIYEDGKIKAPVHLRDGNEQILVDLFSKLNMSKDDYVYSTWASHLHALLKGIPPTDVEEDILEGRSITLHYAEHNFYSSAIVGGISPIATGTALSIKKQNKNNRVYCFLGDMGFRTGITHESIIYSISNDLPITFIIEDNEKSVGTPTQESWGPNVKIKTIFDFYDNLSKNTKTDMVYYKYNMTYPHSGTGVFVEF
jgi:TPP-dependent pyruvate/acetoin dehydrogenase alpha subunit